MNVRVLLADDHVEMRDRLRALLQEEPGFEVVATADDGEEAVRLARELEPDVVVMDINMPNMDGISATQQLRAHSKRIRILALSVHSDSELVAEMIGAGASGFLPKNSAPEELIDAIRTVTKDRMHLGQKVFRSILGCFQKEPPTNESVSSHEFNRAEPRKEKEK